jgi:TolB-like protein
MLRLSIFGRFRAADALGNEIPIKSKKARALLAYLAMPPGKERSREEVMALLWSERSDEQARSSLRQALSGLRKELGEIAVGALKVTDEWLALDPGLVTVEPASPNDVLLAGLHISDPAFDEWLRDERLRHEDAPVADAQPPELPLPDKPSIAVLPFTNMSGDPEQEYFSDGITEDVITELSRFRDLFVIARNSSFSYKGRASKVQNIGRELGVAYVIEGSVRKAGNRVRVTGQMVEAATGNHVWAERYDRDLEDIFVVQDEAVRAIVAAVAPRITSAQLDHARRKTPENLTAYDYFLRGADIFQRNTKEDCLTAQKMLEKAIKLDPNYATAHAQLAVAHYYGFEFGWSAAPSESLAKGLAFARRAVELDPMNSYGHLFLAYGQFYSRQYDTGWAHVERAEALNPNDADTLALQGLFLAYLGRPDDGIHSIERAWRLNPLESEWYGWNQAIALYQARRYQESVTAYQQLLNPGNEALACMAAGYAQLGNTTKARSLMDEFRTRANDELANCPGDDPKGWQTYWSNSFPFKNSADLDHLLDGLRKAGLPV